MGEANPPSRQAGPRIDWATRGTTCCGFHGSGRVPVLEARGSPLASDQWGGAESVQCRGIKSPKCWVVLPCGTASERPLEGLLEEVLLIGGAGFFKSLSGVVYSVQSVLLGAGGQVGEVPEAVSWE